MTRTNDSDELDALIRRIAKTGARVQRRLDERARNPLKRPLRMAFDGRFRFALYGRGAR